MRPALILLMLSLLAEGVVNTYHFRGQHYREFAAPYPINRGEYALDIQGGMGHKLPKFLEKAKRGCKSVE